MKYGPETRFLMWYFDMKRLLDFYGQHGDMINSPFAFPRLPPRASPPLGISNVNRIKDDIVNDANTLIARLSDHHSAFQQYAGGLFNLTPDRFMPGHPMHMNTQTSEVIQENEKLAKENSTMKSHLNKEKKK